MMTFGLFLSFMQIYEEQRGLDMYKNMLELAVLADDLGFNNIWVPEHHLIHYIPAPNALLVATQVGQHVKNATVGTAVVLLPFHHPLAIAGDIAATDNMLEGKFELGVARGAYKYEFDRFEQEFGDSRARFDESLEILEKIWHSEEKGIEHSGRFWSFENTYVWPRPVQSPHPPVWVGLHARFHDSSLRPQGLPRIPCSLPPTHEPHPAHVRCLPRGSGRRRECTWGAENRDVEDVLRR